MALMFTLQHEFELSTFYTGVLRYLPLPILGTGCVNSLVLVCELTTWAVADDTSYKAVAAKCITWCESSNGG
jgi:hypothetical protein